MSEQKLPEGWIKVELGDVLDYEQPTNYIVSNEEYDDSYETPVLTAGKSFLLGRTNDTDGIYTKLPVIIFDDFTTASQFVTFPFKVKSSAMKLLTPKNKEVDLKYIFWLMQTIKVDATTHKRYYLSKYQHIMIALPPLPTQQKIVSILEKAEQLKQLRKEADELTNQLLQSIFLEMFGDPRNNFKNWEYKTLPELVTKDRYAIKRGPFGGSLKKEIFTNQGFLVYEQYHAIYENFSMAKYFIDKQKYNEMEMFKVVPGDLIISCSGTLGKIAEIPTNAIPGIINQALLKISLDQTKINNSFFKMLFQNKATQDLLFGISRGSGISNFPPMTTINSIKFIVPPIILQNKFAQIVKKVETIKQSQKQSNQELNNLFNNIMQKAFKGELIQ
jgi:type I restriction enzyme, S subunit